MLNRRHSISFPENTLGLDEKRHIMNVLAIGNQKGGTAKTTTVAALGVLLSRLGQQVHLIDMDPQASLTAAFGVEDPDGNWVEFVKRG